MSDADTGGCTEGTRTLHFPGDDSLGQLSRIGWVGSDEEDWEDLGEARGTVIVPAAARLQRGAGCAELEALWCVGVLNQSRARH